MLHGFQDITTFFSFTIYMTVRRCQCRSANQQNFFEKFLLTPIFIQEWCKFSYYAVLHITHPEMNTIFLSATVRQTRRYS